MKDLLLRCDFPVGDNILLTAAVRDLHLSYPNYFRTAIETHFPSIWEHNLYVTAPNQLSQAVETIDCDYSLINQSNLAPYHAIHTFIHFFNKKLGIKINPSVFKGDIYISKLEKAWASQVQELTGRDMPFWLILTGGKHDVTTKWWPIERYQKIVHHFQGKIQFVQVGGLNDHHPSLRDVIDLRGKTDIRQLIRLVYHAQGILCPITSLMHLAAAIEVKSGTGISRPAVIIAGGREPSQWEAYPNQQFIHTNGSLLCCDQGGCWKSRTIPLGDGSKLDNIENLCVDVVKETPHCMDLISVDHVVRRMEMYFQGGSLSYLNPQDKEAFKASLAKSKITPVVSLEEEYLKYQNKAEIFLKSNGPYPGGFDGKGIVICGGGITYFTNAWVCINMLRRFGCNLPIQLWYLGKRELDDKMKTLVQPLGVTCIDALAFSNSRFNGQFNGWNLKAYSLLNSSFREVLFLDADNMPVCNPEYLFETPEYKNKGAIFWPDLQKLPPTHPIWTICGVAYQDEPEFDSGQILINKEVVWKPLSLALWYNENSAFYYQYIYGDKDTYHLAFRKLNTSYAMPSTPALKLEGALCQHDFNGRRVFQHRNLDKWNLIIRSRKISGFYFQKTCRNSITSLRKLWDGQIEGSQTTSQSTTEIVIIKEITSRRYVFYAHDCSHHELSFTIDGRIDSPRREQDWSWKILSKQGTLHLGIYSQNTLVTLLAKGEGRTWRNVDGETAHMVPIYKRKAKGTLWLRAAINSYTGYGLHAIQIASDVSRKGYDCKIIPISLSEQFSQIPDYIRERLVTKTDSWNWELLLHGPNRRPTPNKKTIYFTMWESTELPSNGVHYLNEAECIIVPSRWNLELLKQRGVTKPIYQVPLGINTNVFKYFPTPVSGACIFGTGGRKAVGGNRKGFEDVVEAFIKAFPTEKDVFLFVKVFPDCDIQESPDSRIILTKKYLSEREMMYWYRSLTCFVSGAYGEGWGLMQHQALAIGRPVISVNYGGVTEFFDQEVGYPVDYTLVPAEGHYKNCGLWAKPSQESLIERMRQVYANRNEAILLGKNGTKKVSGLTWKASNLKLIHVLHQINAI